MSQKKNEGILFSAEIRVVGSSTDRLLNFLRFSRDAYGIITKSFVPATDTVDQRPNVSPFLAIFAELTTIFFVHVLN